MKPALRTTTSRRRLAVMACLVWLLGVEVLPDLHLATHAWLPAHHHAGDAPLSGGLTVNVRADATAASTHAHDGVLHRHGGPGAGEQRDTGDAGVERTDRAPAPGHGQDSLAHHALALVAPAPAIVAPLPIDQVVVPISHAVAQLVAIAPPPGASARAPPV